MIIPKKVKVGGHTYKVLFPYNFRERVDLDGQVDHNVAEIRVSGSDTNSVKRTRSMIEQVFFHELLHCIDFAYNGSKLDDDTVERISQGLYAVLKDNGFLKENGRDNN